jgi:transposase-like protein
MTAVPSIDMSGWLHEPLGQASPDLLRAMLTTFVPTLMGAEADAVCGAEYGTGSNERTNTRNGYRHRDWDTRAGTIDVAIPKLRQGSYFPDWLLERRRRAEAALVSVVAISYLLGVSTRRMDKLVETLGITRLSKSQVSVMANDLDAQVQAFRTRPLDAGPYTFVAADALVLKVREGGRTINVQVNVGALLAVGVNADGSREILGLQVTSAEDGAGWLAFFRDPSSQRRPRPHRSRAGDQRRAHRAGRGDRCNAARRELATMQDALRRQPHVRDPEVGLGMGESDAALGL